MKKLLSLFLVIVSCFVYTLILSPTSYAASSTSDPLVVVSQDVTATSHCTASTIINVGTLKQRTDYYACSAGSVMETHTISLSQAKSQHLSYVLLPPLTASLAVKTQALLHIKQLGYEAQKKVLKIKQELSVIPVINCGSSATPSKDWTANGNQMHTYVHYTKNCNGTISITFSGVQGNTSKSAIYWYDDQYANWSGTINNCPYIGLSNQTVNWNTNIGNSGYYYEHYLMSPVDCSYIPIGGFQWYWENILLN